MPDNEIAVVSTLVPRAEVDLSEVSAKTRVVHLYKYPSTWAVEEILARAPNLRALEVPPCAAPLVSAAVRQMLAARGVDLAVGRRPEKAPSRAWRTERAFFLGLDEPGREALREVLSLDLTGVRLAVRYLCLAGEPYLPLHRVAAEAGSGIGPSAVVAWIAAIRRHLDPSREISPTSEKYLRWLRARIEKSRAAARRAAAEGDLGAAWGELLAEVGLTLADLPAGLPVTQRARFVEAAWAARDGRLEALRAVRPAAAHVLMLRYGLGGGPYRTLDEIASERDVTRERVRQLEDRALRYLREGVPPPPSPRRRREKIRKNRSVRDAAAVAEIASAFRDGRASALTGRQAEVLRLRYGVDDGRVRTLKGVGEVLGIGFATVRGCEQRAIERIRELRQSGLDNQSTTG